MCGGRTAPGTAKNKLHVQAALLDSGSNVTAVRSAQYVSCVQKYTKPQPLGLAASGHTAHATAEGNCEFDVLSDRNTWIPMRQRVQIVPTFANAIFGAVAFRHTHGLTTDSKGNFVKNGVTMPVREANGQTWLTIRFHEQNKPPAQTAAVATTWDDLTSPARDAVTGGTVCEPTMGVRKIARLCDSTLDEAREIRERAQKELALRARQFPMHKTTGKSARAHAPRPHERMTWNKPRQHEHTPQRHGKTGKHKHTPPAAGGTLPRGGVDVALGGRASRHVPPSPPTPLASNTHTVAALDNTPPPPPPKRERARDAGRQKRPHERAPTRPPRQVTTAVKDTWKPAARQREVIDNMSVRQLLKALCIKDTLQWGRGTTQHARMRAASMGTLTYDTTKDLFMRTHHAYGHPSFAQTARLLRAQGVKLGRVTDMFCDHCEQAKAHRQPVGKQLTLKADESDALTYFHLDCFGPFPPSQPHALRFCWLFLSRQNTIYAFMTRSQDEFRAVQQMFVRRLHADLRKVGCVDVQKHMRQVTIKSDSASYFKSASTRAEWDKQGITVAFSPPNCQARNGLAETTGKWLKRRAAAALAASGNHTQVQWWSHAFRMVLWAADRLPTSRGGPSPYEQRLGVTPPTHDVIAPFAKVVVHRPERKGAFKHKGDIGVFLGWDAETDAATIHIPRSGGDGPAHVTVRSIHFTVDRELPNAAIDNFFVDTHENDIDIIAIDDEDVDSNHDDNNDTVEAGGDAQDTINLDQWEEDAGQTINIDTLMDTPQGPATHAVEDLDPNTTDLAIVIANMTEEDRAFFRAVSQNKNKVQDLCFSIKAALRSAGGVYQGHVMTAVDKELRGMFSSGALRVAAPNEFDNESHIHRIVPLYHPKFSNEEGAFKERRLLKYKLRCAFDGRCFTRDDQDDMWCGRTDTSAPRMETWRLHMSLAAATRTADGSYANATADPHDPHTHFACDISQAYLQTELLTQSPTGSAVLLALPADLQDRAEKIGLIKSDAPRLRNGKQTPLCVERAAYGIPSAGRMWMNCMVHTLVQKFNCRQSELEVSMFYFAATVRVCVFVDDLSIRGRKSECVQLIKLLESEWGDMATRENPSTLLGWDLRHENGCISISATAHIDKLAELCSIENMYKRYTPLRAGLKYSKSDRAAAPTKFTRVAQRIQGKLNYIAQIARFDISYAASQFGTVAAAPPTQMLTEMQHTVRYLIHTQNYRIGYRKDLGSDLNKLICYVDASDASEEGSRSQSAFVIFCNGGPVHWGSIKQSMTTLSTGESELVAACLATREVTFMRALCKEMGYPSAGPTEMFTDSEVAVRWLEPYRAITKKNKHVDRQQFYTQQAQEAGTVTLEHCPGADNCADVGTKNSVRAVVERMNRVLYDPDSTSTCRTTSESSTPGRGVEPPE